MHFLDASTRWSKQGITGRSAVSNLDVGYNDRTMNKLHEIKRWVSINRYLRNIRFVKEDVMGIYIYIYIGPIFKGRTALPLKIKPTCSSETSVLNHPTLCNISVDGRLFLVLVWESHYSNWYFTGCLTVGLFDLWDITGEDSSSVVLL